MCVFCYKEGECQPVCLPLQHKIRGYIAAPGGVSEALVNALPLKKGNVFQKKEG